MDKKIIEGNIALQQAYDKLRIQLESNKDSIIGGKQLVRNLKALNISTEKYFHLPDSILKHYNRLNTYRTIDSLLRYKIVKLPREYVRSFLQIDKLNNHVKQVKELEKELSVLYKTDIRQLFVASYWQNYIKHTGFTSNYSGQIGNSFFGQGTYWTNNLQLGDQLTINNIPLSIKYVYQQYNDNGFNDKHALTIDFDKDAFLDNYRNKILGKFNADNIIPKDELLQSVIHSAETTLFKDLSSLNNIDKVVLNDMVKKLSAEKDIIISDISVLRQKLFGGISEQSIADNERILRELELRLQSGHVVEIDRINLLHKQVQEEKSSIEIFNKIVEHKKKWTENGLVKKIISDHNFRDGQFRELLRDPHSVKHIAGKYFRIGGIEKLLMSVSSLKGGRQTTSLTNLTLNNFMSDGFSMELQSGKKYLFVLLGQQQQFHSIYDAASFQPLQPKANLAMGIRIGTGNLNGTHSHLSVFSYGMQPQIASSSYLNALDRSSLVFGLSNKLVNGPSIIAIEVSHSTMRFRNELENELPSDPMNKNVRRQRFADGLAVDAQYETAFEDVGLNVSMNALVTGHTYYNPGNAFLTQGLKQFNFSGKKAFYKNRLQLRMRNTWRQIHFAYDRNDKWRQNMLALDVRWQLNNGQYVGLQYQPMRSVKLEGDNKYKMGMTDRLSAEFNFQKRLRQIVYRNIINLSHNSIYYTSSSGNNYQMQSKALQVNTVQNIAFKKHVVYMNTIYSYAYDRSNTFYLNNMFNTDAGFTYAIARKIQASSGLNYYSVKKWYALAGIRQTFTASLGERLQLNVFVDWRTKIKETQYYYNEPLRADCSVRFIF